MIRPTRLVRCVALAFGMLASGAMIAAAQDAQPENLEATGGMEALIAKAKEEGSVLFYGAPSQDKISIWVKDFEEKYGIPVQYFRAPTNQLYQRFSQEQQVGRNQADAIAISDLNVLDDAINKGFIDTYVPANASKFPTDAVVDGLSYPMYVTVQAIGWNTSVVPEDLQKKLQEDPLEALLDERLKDKIAIVTVTAGGPQIAANGNLVFNQADEYGWDYMEKLAAQNPAVVPSTTTLLDSIIAGDYWATPDANPSVFAPKAVDGAPIAFAFPEVASATQFNLALASNAPHPNAARLFMEWATSVEAQSALAEIAESDVTIEGWEDRRKVREMPWYQAANELWFGAPRLPELQDEKRTEFYEQWQSLFGR